MDGKRNAHMVIKLGMGICIYAQYLGYVIFNAFIRFMNGSSRLAIDTMQLMTNATLNRKSICRAFPYPNKSPTVFPTNDDIFGEAVGGNFRPCIRRKSLMRSGNQMGYSCL